MKKAAAWLLLFSYIVSPITAFAEAAPDTVDTVDAPTGDIFGPDPIIIPVHIGPDEAGGEGSSEDAAPIEEGSPKEDTEPIGEDTSKDQSLPEEEAPSEPQAQAMQGSADSEAGSLFIQTDTTHSASPDVDTQTGALQYEYAIGIPPGIESATPDVRLSYSSNSVGNANILGYGWAPSIPSIHRTNKYGSDLLYASSTFSSSLDGELVQVASTTRYVPRTENGSFREYTFASSTWTVRDKEGVTFTFGSTTASRRDDPGNSSRVYAWYLDESRDANDNYVSYSYFKDAGQIYPAAITYSNHASTTGMFSIAFDRESRPDTLISYETGFLATTTYRIKRIEARMNGDWVFAYDLAYGSGSNGKRSLLSSITKSGKDETGVVTTLPSTNFTYEGISGSDKGWNLDASLDIPVTLAYDKTGKDDGARFIDINGDGLNDIVRSYGWDPYPSNPAPHYIQQEVYLHTGNGWATTSAWTIPTPIDGRFGFGAGLIHYGGSYYAYSVDLGARFADVNNDGYTDILWAYHTSDLYIGAGGYSYDYTIRDVYLNNKVNGWATSTAWTLPAGILFANDADDSGVRVIDINGDRLPDLVGNSANYLNTGAGWTLASTSWALPEPLQYVSSDGGTRFADVNGDGLPDVLRSVTTDAPSQFAAINKVYLNTGNGWVLRSDWSIPVGFARYTLNYGMLSNSPRLIDVNGDGLNDIVRSSSSVTYGDGNDLYINTGRGWVQDSGWSLPPYFKIGYTSNGVKVAESGVAEMDLDGDNMIDFVKSGPIDSYPTYPQAKGAYLHKAKVPDLLSSIEYPEGGTITAVYEQSARYKDGSVSANPRLSSNLNTVRSVTYDDTVGNPYTHEYFYGGGENYYASSTDTQFAGFATTTLEDGRGNTTATYIHQGNGSLTSLGEYADSFYKIGKAYLTEVRDEDGDLYTRTITKWDSQPVASTSAFVYPARTVTQQYDGDSDHRDRATEHTFDARGNITTRIEWGEVTATSTDGTFTDMLTDKRTTTYTYASSTPTALPSRLAQETLTNYGGIRVRESKHYYDGLAQGALSKGNRTKQQDAISFAASRATSWAYDDYGQVVQEVDPRFATTTYAYDSQHLYKATTTNALSQVTRATYDYSSGNVRTATDPNGYVTQNTYDGLDRLLTRSIPDPATGVPTLSLATTYKDTRRHVSTESKAYRTATSTTDTLAYQDGFGRVIQQRTSAEDPNVYAVTDKAYGQDGLLARQSLPYFGEGKKDDDPTDTDALWTEYDYDPLNRTVAVENAVGTTQTSYDQGNRTVTDPMSRVTVYGYDAFDRLSSVKEQVASTTYTTSYLWGPSDRLITITDALGNVRNMSYDWLGRRIYAEDLHAGGDATFGGWVYEYDAAGNLSQSTSPNGAVVQYTYDLLNRPVSEDYTGGSGTEVVYAYDACTNGIGKLCTATTTGAVSSYTYRPNGLIGSETKSIMGTPYTTQYAYDLAGNTTELTYPDDSSVRYSFNKAGRIETVDQKESGAAYAPVILDLDYGPHGQVTYEENANRSYLTNAYDENQLYRLTRKTVQTLVGASSSQSMMMRTSGQAPESSFEQPLSPSAFFTPDGVLKSAAVESVSSLATGTTTPVQAEAAALEPLAEAAIDPVLNLPVAKENELKALPASDPALRFKTPLDRHLGMQVSNGVVKYAYRTDIAVDTLPVDKKVLRAVQKAGIALGGEVVEKRTKYARTFATNKPNVYVAEISGGDPVYYEDAQGAWWVADYGVTTKGSYDEQVAEFRAQPLPKESVLEKLMSLGTAKVVRASGGTFYPDTDPEVQTVDGHVSRYSNSSWSSIRSSSNGTSYSDSGTTINVQSVRNSSSYRTNSRGYLLFDTSSIPDGAAILNANLTLYVTGQSGGSYRLVHVVSSNPGSTTALGLGDYNDIGGTSYGISGLISTSNVYETIPLNTAGKDAISKTGITKLGLRTEVDLTGIGLGSQESAEMSFGSSESPGIYHDPKLFVAYGAAPGVATALRAKQHIYPSEIAKIEPDFSGVFVDPDSDDSAQAYQIQVSTSPNDFTAPAWDSGKKPFPTPVPNGYRSPDIAYAGNPLSTDVTYYWRMKFWDSGDSDSSWSTTTVSFTLTDPPPPIMDTLYLYDAVGNITATVDIRDQNNPTATVYTYDELNRLLQVGTTTAAIDSLDEVVTIQPGPLEGKDTYYGTAYVTAGDPDADIARIGGWGDDYYSYFQFPLTALKDYGEVIDAKLYLRNINTNSYNEAKLLRITDQWEEADINLTVNPPAVDPGLGWTPVVHNGWTVFDATQLVKDWDEKTYPNYGVKISALYTSGDHVKAFVTSDAVDPLYRPKLVITARPGDYTPEDVTLGATTTVTESYSYNPIGNILNSTGKTYQYAGTGYANPHAVTSIASTTYAYDNNGNVTNAGAAFYGWDYRNRLINSGTGGLITGIYRYDHAGARVSKAGGGVMTAYPNDYYQKAGASTTKNIYIGDQLIASVYGTGTTTATTTFVHGDHLGSTRLVTDGSGYVIQGLGYGSFGAQTASTTSTSLLQSNRYIGEQYDANSSLSYLNARYYDGGRGQFLSQDPSFLDIGSAGFEQKYERKLQQHLMNPQALNSYSYGLNNPITNKDPEGEIVPLLIAGWAAAEIGLSAYDAYNVYQTANDPNATQLEKSIAVGGFAAGLYAPGGGYGSAGKALVGQSFGKAGTVIENSAGKINSFYRSYAKDPYHGLNQTINRGVNPKVLLDTVKNPLVTLKQAGGNILRLTNEAGVVLDKSGNVVTSYTKNQFLPHIKNILNKANSR